MRTRLTSFGLVALLLLGSGTTFAQRSGKRMNRNTQNPQMRFQQNRLGMANILDLTEDQQKQFQEIRISHQKEMVYDNNLIREKEAHLQTLLSAVDRDMKAINKTIDDISSSKGELMKKRIANREDMKSILTPEQIEKIGAFGPAIGRKAGRGFGQRQGFTQGQGFGQRQGFTQGRRGAMGPCGAGIGPGNNQKGMNGRGFNTPSNKPGAGFGAGF
ncbi:MAG: Spy/CpxP family protein refolding chaperone [Bacteroidota bacterium]|nr:Spy/CpxP family protein refolding chaperone [Bacteroidota bacterium]